MSQQAARILGGVFGVLLLNGCVTAPEVPEAPRGPRQMEEPQGPDLGLLQRQLNLDRNISELGFEEKAFNPCQHNLSTPPQCSPQRLVVIHFKLDCRNTQGTAATVESYTTEPLRADMVNWKLGAIEGTTSTDHEGFGQIRTLASGSAKKNKLRLTINGKFMALTAEEIRRVVVPGDWCGR